MARPWRPRGDVMTEEQREEAARSYFDAEMGELASTATLLIEDIPGTNEVSVSATNADAAQHRASRAQRRLGAVRGLPTPSAAATTSKLRSCSTSPGSMAGQRIIDLREAATDLVDTVIREQQTPYYSKIALVPYSMGVNAGSYADEARGDIAGPSRCRQRGLAYRFVAQYQRDHTRQSRGRHRPTITASRTTTTFTFAM